MRDKIFLDFFMDILTDINCEPEIISKPFNKKDKREIIAPDSFNYESVRFYTLAFHRQAGIINDSNSLSKYGIANYYEHSAYM